MAKGNRLVGRDAFLSRYREESESHKGNGTLAGDLSTGGF